MIKIRLSSVAMAVLVLIAGAARAEKPVQLALWPPDIQMVAETESIKGLRLEVYGRNQNMTGLDLGLCHESTGDFKGVALGVASLAGGSAHGLQWTWIYSKAGADMIGWQSGLLVKSGAGSQGIQTSAVALNEGDFAGVQLSWLYNCQAQHISGVQLALVNRATSVKGVQLGLVNLTEQMNGLQIGLWNQINSKESWKVIPIVNFKF